MLQLFVHRIETLLEVFERSESVQFQTVARAILWMENQPPASYLQSPIWSNDAATQNAFERLSQKWRVGNDDVPKPSDYQDVVLLLSSAKLDFEITDPKTADLTSLLFSDELRLAGIVVAASQRDRAIMLSLLQLKLSSTDILLEVLNACLYAHNVRGQLSTSLPLGDDRVTVEYVVKNVQMSLQHFPITKMLPEPSAPRSLARIRFATMAAIASMAIRHLHHM